MSRAIVALVTSLKASDVALVLISGGGSALLTLPKVSITLDEYKATVRMIAAVGAPIEVWCQTELD
jgi:hydroxypyruvate reductase